MTEHRYWDSRESRWMYPDEGMTKCPECNEKRSAHTFVAVCPTRRLPLHRTEAGWPHCSTCDGGGCPDCTDPA